MAEILIKNGTIIDPSRNLMAKRDLCIRDGVIASDQPSGRFAREP